jgi:membrane associated rhomboid family serine protease
MKTKLLFVLTILFAVVAIWNVIAVSYVLFGKIGVISGVLIVAFIAAKWPSVVAISSKPFFAVIAIFSVLSAIFGPLEWYSMATGLGAIILLVLLIGLNDKSDKKMNIMGIHPQAGHSL